MESSEKRSLSEAKYQEDFGLAVRRHASHANLSMPASLKQKSITQNTDKNSS